MTGALRQAQLAMARYLRDPHRQPPPAGVEQRRLRVYEELVYNNIESFISGAFPVLRSLYDDARWRQLVRAFIDQHRCRTPYFLEISQEFLHYLLERHQARDCDPPFLAELAHYEWVELALDVSTDTLVSGDAADDLAGSVPHLSPLAWSLCYRYPVHRIGAGNQPSGPGEPTYLVVYRDAGDRVRFMELNAATARLLELVRDNSGADLASLLAGLAAELQRPVDTVLAFGIEQAAALRAESVLYFTEPVAVTRGGS